MGAGVEVGGTSLAHLAGKDRPSRLIVCPPGIAVTLMPMVRLLLPVLVIATGTATAAAAVILPADAPPTSLASTVGSVQVARVPIAEAVVRDSAGGTRGPTSAALSDGRMLLGGGADGTRLLVMDPAIGVLQEVGQVIRPEQRLDDARFAPTDIEVMSTKGARVRLFVSFPEFVAGRKCVRLAVNRVDVRLDARPRILRTTKVLRSKPCVPPANIQHASGKLVRDHGLQRLCHPRRPRLSRHQQPRRPRAARLGPADRRGQEARPDQPGPSQWARASRWTAWAGSGRPSTAPGVAMS